MKKFKFVFLLVILVQFKSVDLKFYTDNANDIMKQLIAYDSVKIKEFRELNPIIQQEYQENIYYSPYRAVVESDMKNSTYLFKGINNGDENSVEIAMGKDVENRFKRAYDPTFRGNPKTRQEVWQRNFKSSTSEFTQSTSLVVLLSKVIEKYMGSCIPVVLYDEFIEESEGFIIQRLFQSFPTSFMHGKINRNYTLNNLELLKPPDSKCRSYILFVNDALMTRRIIGPQIDNKVIVIPRSTQWKLQEFLSSPLSRDIINLLVIGESYITDKTKERPYVLYTHQLYTDGLGSSKPIVLTSWMKGRLSRPHIDLFPIKLTKGFSGHRFSVSAANQPPFVFKRLSTDGVGNINIKWDGYEYRVLKVLGKMMNFTFDINEPRGIAALGAGDAVAESIIKRQYDIGMGGMYVTTERNYGMEMSVSHSTDCAAFISLTSKALPRYRAIMGPFQWPVWLALIVTYLVAIIPLAYSDSLTLRYLIEKPGQIENMFWYVFGTFTNSLTFSGELSWSNSTKTSTRLLIGWYWVFTIIITACYTGSIIAFVTLPVFPETVDTIDQLNDGFYRIGTLDRGGWERWFLNSSQKETAKLLRNLEFVVNIEEGISNVTKAFFWSYAFIGSKSQLEYVIQANYSDNQISKRSALHISRECFALFGVSLAYQLESVYRQKLNDGLLALQQSGILIKIMNDVRWDMQRTNKGRLLQISSGKTLKMNNQEERGLTLADTEGMFLLLGIGFLIAGCVLVSEWVGGCTNKCMTFMKVRKEQKTEDHRIEVENIRLETEEIARIDGEIEVIRVQEEIRAREILESSSSKQQVPKSPKKDLLVDEILEIESQEDLLGSLSDSDVLSRSDVSGHTRSGSSITSLNKMMLSEMYTGPRRRHSTIVMMNGKMMTEDDAKHHAKMMQQNAEDDYRGASNEISKVFSFLNPDEDDEETFEDMSNKSSNVCQVEINFHAPSPHLTREVTMDDCFGEKAHCMGIFPSSLDMDLNFSIKLREKISDNQNKSKSKAEKAILKLYLLCSFFFIFLSCGFWFFNLMRRK